jgi:hypothetical protein
MPIRHHEVPTHLDVEDKVLLGLTVRQFLYLLVGSSATYAVWEQLAVAISGVRIAAAAGCVAVTLAFALLRPAGRALEDWLVAALFYAATPHRNTWRPAEPDCADWRPANAAWHELIPSPVWAEGDET